MYAAVEFRMIFFFNIWVSAVGYAGGRNSYKKYCSENWNMLEELEWPLKMSLIWKRWSIGKLHETQSYMDVFKLLYLKCDELNGGGEKAFCLNHTISNICVTFCIDNPLERREV